MKGRKVIFIDVMIDIDREFIRAQDNPVITPVVQ
jgi:hypothetical protein